MTDNEIRAATSEAIQYAKQRIAAEGLVYPVRLAYTKCRWCGKAIHAGMFCGRGCTHEFYGTTEADREY